MGRHLRRMKLHPISSSQKASLEDSEVEQTENHPPGLSGMLIVTVNEALEKCKSELVSELTAALTVMRDMFNEYRAHTDKQIEELGKILETMNAEQRERMESMKQMQTDMQEIENSPPVPAAEQAAVETQYQI